MPPLSTPAAPPDWIEFFCGIGGVATALAPETQILAIDQNPLALAFYRANHAHTVWNRNICGLRAAELPSGAFWWLSPPCQPYTIKGARRDAEDPRAAPLKHLIRLLPQCAPPTLYLENVPGFVGSQMQQLLLETLRSMDYNLEEVELCPTHFGVPMRRRRYYLRASRGLEPLQLPPPRPLRPLREWLGEEEAELRVSDVTQARYVGAIHEVDPNEEGAIATCFGSAYGRSVVRAGSYLRVPGGLRAFSPREVLRLLGFGEPQLPARLSRLQLWSLAGNSVSVPVLRWLLAGH